MELKMLLKEKNRLLHCTLLILFVALIISPAAYSRDWVYIGSGLSKGTQKFNIFIDQNSIKNNDGQIEFWQGHVFDTTQQLNGISYNKINLFRMADCTEQKGNILRVFFYNGTIEVISKEYNEIELAEFKDIKRDSVDGEVLRFVCKFIKN